MKFPEKLRYTKDHEWIRVEADAGFIGITDFAQGELGDIVFVELPAVGKRVEHSQAFGTVEAVKAVSDLYSPVTGEILEVNKKIHDSPELVNKDPYEQGWMIKVKIEKPAELELLLDVETYKKLVAK